MLSGFGVCGSAFSAKDFIIRSKHSGPDSFGSLLVFAEFGKTIKAPQGIECARGCTWICGWGVQGVNSCRNDACSFFACSFASGSRSAVQGMEVCMLEAEETFAHPHL